jgi:glyoxylase-like metal-dependent hydrolase (beta-lactamase superfamily II)/rhodanese-related sulfurtransferase
MQVEQIYTGCLAQGAYYISSNGEAAIIDPLREVSPYVERAQKDGNAIKYIFETHFHADFVSGHLDLAKQTGGTIVFGPTAKPSFDALVAEDNQEFAIGNVKIRAIHTPGHTMESTTYLLIDENGKESAIFTGDTLFIGDVGRPDLAQKVIAELTQEKLASHLYHSLREKIMPLSDDIIVYPGHGAGSACGKNMSKETTDTLGNQKKTNYALREGLDEPTFIAELLDGLMPPPGYFPKNVLMNIQGYASIDDVMSAGLRELSPEAFEAAAEETDALVLDTRKAEDFANGFVPGSVNIGIDGSFAPWVGTLIPDIQQAILIVAEPGEEQEVVTRLARVGYDGSIGFLKGGFVTWKDSGKPFETIESIEVDEFASRLEKDSSLSILDVRKASEFYSQRIEGAINGPLDYINDSMTLIDPKKTYYVHCAGGYRSMIFISILKARGYDNLIDVKGGFNAIKNNLAFKVTDYVCPTTML